jgi:hypothetical protein
MGGLMLALWAIRFFAFTLHESPKYLMGKGKHDEAVDVVHKVAAYNKKTSSLVVQDLQILDRLLDGTGKTITDNGGRSSMGTVSLTDMNHIKPLFATRTLAYSTSLLIALWGESFNILERFQFKALLALIGLAFPLQVVRFRFFVVFGLTFTRQI